MKYRFVKVPRPCPREAYDHAAEKIAAHASRFPEVCAVYRMGNVAMPGISDLDMIVVIREGCTVPPFDFIKNLDPREKYTLLHEVFVLPEKFWSNRHLFYRFENLELLAGMETPATRISQEWQRWARLRMAFQHMIRLYFSLFVQLNTHVIRTRSLLCELHALRFDEMAVRELLSDSLTKTLENLTGVVDLLRRNWFLNPEASKAGVASICPEVKHTLKEMVEEISRHPELQMADANMLSSDPASANFCISKQRLIFPSAQYLAEHRSLTASLLALLARLPLGETFLLKMTSHLGTYGLDLPWPIYNYSTDPAWARAGRLRQEFVKSRTGILSLQEMRAIRQYGFSVPALEFVPCNKLTK